MNHKYYECPKPCQTEYCQYCEGGLGLCTVCGGAEGTLTTHCPGERMMPTLEQAVYQGRIDFKDGRWAGTPTGMVGSHAKVHEIEDFVEAVEKARAAWIHHFRAPEILKALRRLRHGNKRCTHTTKEYPGAIVESFIEGEDDYSETFTSPGVGAAGYSYCTVCGEEKP